MTVTPKTMPGVLELLPLDQAAFNGMLASIRSVFELFGFQAIETPAIELSEVLLTKTGGETERQVYFVQSTGAIEQGGAPSLALPFDLTVPLARYVAEHEQDLAFPFRRYQMQKVFRGESPQRGRFREFYQCDIDVVDRDYLDMRNDAEIVAVINQVFEKLGFGEFTIRISNRRLLKGTLESLGVDDLDVQASVLREVDKLERRGDPAVRATLADIGLVPEAVNGVMALAAKGMLKPSEALGWLRSLAAPNDTLAAGIAELILVLETVDDLGVPEDRYVLDPSITRGLDYYTGTVYETRLDAHPEIGSICSGGRYEDLAGMFTSTSLPGVGISIGLTRLFWQLKEAGLVDGATSHPGAVVTLMDPDGLRYSLELAARLRAAGINTTVMFEATRLGKQLKHTDRIGARFAVIAGSNERKTGTVTIKDFVNKTQEEVAVADAAAHILRINQEKP